MPIRNTYLIDSKRIELFDQLLSASETEQYVTALEGAAFTRTESAGPETAATKHFVSEMPMAALQHVPLLAKTLELLNATFAGEYAAYRAYTNLALPGDLLYSHVDCTADQRDVTALWYLCRTWHRDWAGETVFSTILMKLPSLYFLNPEDWRSLMGGFGMLEGHLPALQLSRATPLP